MVAAEGVPFCKTGGLADVIGSLPQELSSQGIEVAVMMPKYRDIPEAFSSKMEFIGSTHVSMGWRKPYVGVMKYKHQDITFFFIDNEQYFGRPGFYGYFDDGERFAFFCRAVLSALPVTDFQPDVIHCHDWHTGLLPVFITQYADEFYSKMKTVFTIHNLKFQGVFNKSIMTDFLELGWEYFHADGIEFHDNVSFMKGALNFADLLTTVSPTYAQEIQTPYFGCNLDGVLRKRSDQLVGVLNGIDYQEWNPKTDPHIFTNFGNGAVKKKRENKLGLQEQLGLPQKEEVPLIGLVTRLTDQKGLDLVSHVLEDIAALDLQVVVLGTGEAQYERLFKDAAFIHPDKVAACITFDNQLAHRIYAGSDMFLMPSLFEPCGLGQLIALRYGSLPLVRQTGGLKDTVLSFESEGKDGNGFSFTNYNAHEMLFMMERAIEQYRDRKSWLTLVRNAMKADYSWTQSATTYISLYEGLL